MSNVYALAKRFYDSNYNFAEIMPQEIVEKYLRRKAWQGAGDQELKDVWSILSLLILYVEQGNLYSLASLSVYDYQEIIYRYAQAHKEFRLTEKPVLAVVADIEDFYGYLPEDAQEMLATLKELRESLFEDNQFVMPLRRNPDDFYSSLEHKEEISEAEMDKLNALMDALMHHMDDFFRRPAYKKDMDRALHMFIGPEDIFLMEELSDEEAHSFWLCFWDFFLFDYHMIAADESPIQVFYRLHKEKMIPSERDILLDLMRTDFSVLSLDYYEADRVVCRDLFTGEICELPLQAVYDGNAGESIIYGHTCTKGVMMLNYITVLPASRKLQKRMKEEILKLYDLFKCQYPAASFSDFSRRHAGAIRHTLNILSQFAQLNVGPGLSVRKMALGEAKGFDASAANKKCWMELAMNSGLSKFSAGLAYRLFCDYMSKAGDRYKDRDLPAVMISVLMKFVEINGADLSAAFEQMGELASSEEIADLMADIQKKLAITLFDPRYLSEEGLIHSLYFEQVES